MRYLGELIRAQLENRTPQEQAQSCRNALKTSTLKTLLQVQIADRLQEKLEEAGIRNQVLKGAVMKHIYPRPELREMSDIDFMIYEDDFTDTDRIVEEAGFVKVQAIKHHVIYQKAPFLTLEMHWDLYEKTVDKSQYMISHMAKHFYENGCGIRNLVDIYVFNQKYGHSIDRTQVKQELKKCGILNFERQMSELALIWLENRKCSKFYVNLFRYMIDCGIYGKGENGIWSQLCKQNAPQQKKSFNLTYYFPTAQYMKEYYPWLEGKEGLLPLAWLCRGVHGLLHRDSMERAKTLKDREKYRMMMEIYHNLNLNFVK